MKQGVYQYHYSPTSSAFLNPLEKRAERPRRETTKPRSFGLGLLEVLNDFYVLGNDLSRGGQCFLRMEMLLVATFAGEMFVGCFITLFISFLLKGKVFDISKAYRGGNSSLIS